MAKQKAIPTLGFDHFLTYGETTDFLKGLVAARPGLCRLASLGPSREGRDVHLLTVTDLACGAPEDRPAYVIQANIHAGEVAGTHAALFTARQLLADAEASDFLRRVVFYIVPRLNPDGAEFSVTTCGRVRSRTDRCEREPNTLYQEDMDADGLILTMRQQHPDGAFVADPQDRRLMIRRRAGAAGPFYRVLPEGRIHAWDGSDEIRQEGRSFDWNRNWSYDWRPEPEQEGAGDFPFSEPEMHHLGAFLHSRPNVFGLLGYHTGPGAVLRPPSTGSDEDMEESDVGMLEELAQIGSKETGFPVIAVVKYHYARYRDINLRGHFHNFGYHHLGLFVFEFELGIIHDSAGISTEEQLAVRTEEEGEAQMRQVMKWWDGESSPEPLFRAWRECDHPQLGQVEIGGFLTPHLNNPSLADLSKIAGDTHRFTVHHAGRHPRVVLEDLRVEAVGGEVLRVRVRVANRGELPTHITEKGKKLRRLRPVRVAFHPSAGVELLSRRAHAELGHLEGMAGSRTVEWFVAPAKGSRDVAEIRVDGGTGGNLRQRVTKP